MSVDNPIAGEAVGAYIEVEYEIPVSFIGAAIRNVVETTVSQDLTLPVDVTASTDGVNWVYVGEARAVQTAYSTAPYTKGYHYIVRTFYTVSMYKWWRIHYPDNITSANGDRTLITSLSDCSFIVSGKPDRSNQSVVDGIARWSRKAPSSDLVAFVDKTYGIDNVMPVGVNTVFMISKSSIGMEGAVGSAPYNRALVDLVGDQSKSQQRARPDPSTQTGSVGSIHKGGLGTTFPPSDAIGSYHGYRGSTQPVTNGGDMVPYQTTFITFANDEDTQGLAKVMYSTTPADSVAASQDWDPDVILWIGRKDEEPRYAAATLVVWHKDDPNNVHSDGLTTAIAAGDWGLDAGTRTIKQNMDNITGAPVNGLYLTLVAAQKASLASKVHVWSYVGNGSASLRTFALGFEPKFFMVFRRGSVQSGIGFSEVGGSLAEIYTGNPYSTVDNGLWGSTRDSLTLETLHEDLNFSSDTYYAVAWG
jgi:hypothetical protein